MNQFITILLAGTTVLFMNSCGGGGSSDPVDPSIPVDPITNKYDLRTFLDTGSYSIEGEGALTSPEGTIDLVGSYQTLYSGSNIASDGVTEVHGHDNILILIGEGMTAMTNTIGSTTVMGYLDHFYTNAGNIYCTTLSTMSDLTPVPTDAQIGYISDIVPLHCSDGTYMTYIIELNDAGSENAEISVISNIYESEGGVLQATETSNIVVTPSMDIVNVEMSGRFVTYNTIYSYTLNSTSIAQD